MVLCFTEDTQELLQNLIIAALLELSPCQLPLSCREQFMSRIRVTGIGDESLLTSLLRASFNQGCQSSAAICYLSIAVAFGHNELGRSKAANRVSVTSQMLWPSATTNSGG